MFVFAIRTILGRNCTVFWAIWLLLRTLEKVNWALPWRRLCDNLAATTGPSSSASASGSAKSRPRGQQGQTRASWHHPLVSALRCDQSHLPVKCSELRIARARTWVDRAVIRRSIFLRFKLRYETLREVHASIRCRQTRLNGLYGASKAILMIKPSQLWIEVLFWAISMW